MNSSLTWLEGSFSLLVQTAFSAAILLLVVGCIQKFGSRWLSPKVRHGLWLLVAIRLLILWSPPSSLSLVGMLERNASSVLAWQRDSSAVARIDLVAADAMKPVRSDNHVAPIALEFLPASETIPPPPAPAWWSQLGYWSILALAWAIGTTLFSIRLGSDFWRLRSAVRKMAPMDVPRVILLLRKVELELDLRQEVRILASEQLASPAVTGVFAPVLLMPRVLVERLTEMELEHVFRHELTHVKRRDVLINWLLAGLGTAYWFFPLMGYLLSQLRRTRELACDAAVLKSASPAKCKAYGKTLVRVMEMVLESDRPMLTFTVGVAGMVWPIGNARKDSNMMRERLELVMGRTTRPWGATGIALAMVCVLVVVGFTKGQDAKPSIPEEEITLLSRAGKEDETKSESESLVVNREYDFSETRNLFEANQTLRFAPWHSARSVTTQIMVGKPIAGVGEHELSAKAAMREWVERVVKESGWSEPVEANISWNGEDKATIRHSKQSDERLARALKALQAKPESQLVLELRINSLSAADFAKVDLRGLKTVRTDLAALIAEREERKSRLGSANETVSRRISGQNYLVSDEAMHRIYPALAKLASYQCIQAPKLTLLNAQVGKIITGTTHPFVTKQEPLGKDVEQPLVDVLFRGVQSEMQAIALGENKAWLRWDFQKSDLMGVESAKQIGSDQMVQEPKLWKVSQAVGVEVAEGETIAMFMKLNQPQEDKRDILAVFLTLRETVVSEEGSQEGNVETKNAPPLETILASTVRTEVFDVSRTHAFRGFPSQLKIDDPLRAKLIAPAFEQLEILIKETIDPESPKAFKRSAENLTLEVTASQEVLEKVSDLIKQLVRLADGEIPANQKSSTVTYDVSDLPMTKMFLVDLKEGDQATKTQRAAAIAQFTMTIARALPEISSKKEVVLQPFYHNLTIEVTAPPADQQKIAELMTFLKKMTNVDAKQQLEFNRIFADPSGRRAGSIDEHGNILQVYEVHDQPLFAGLKGFIKEGHPKRELLIAQAEKLQMIIRVEHPIFFEEKLGVALSIFPSNQTLAVNAPQELHEKVKALLKRLSTMTPEDCEKEARRASARKTGYVAPLAESQASSDFNERRIGVEFTPPVFGKRRDRNQEQAKSPEANDESKDKSKGATVTYDVSNFCDVCTPKSKGGKQADNVDCGNPLVHVFVVLNRVLPDVEPGKNGVELQPFLRDKKLIVAASLETHEKIAEVINYMNKLSIEDAKRLIEDNNSSEVIREREIYFALKQPVEVKFKDKPLSDVLLLFGKTTKINIVPDMAGFVEEGIQPHKPVSLDLPQPVSLRSALRHILDPLGLDFVIKNEALVITSKRLTTGLKTTVAYDIAGLPFFKELWTGLKEKEQPNQAAITAAFERVQGIIKNKIPAFTQENEPAEIQPFYVNLTLVVSATKEDQEKVAALIKQLEKMPLADAEKLTKEAALRR